MQFRERFAVVAVVLAVALAMAYVKPEWFAKPATEKRVLLLQELNRIAAPPNAMPLSIQEGARRSDVLLFQPYRGPGDHQSLVSFYDKQLTALGWSFLREKSVRELWGNSGDVERIYCRNDNKIVLVIAGANAHHEWNYGIEVAWFPTRSCVED